MKKAVRIGNVVIGGKNPVAIQSMTNTLTKDYLSTINQINSLADAGAHLVRIAVMDNSSVNVVDKIIPEVKVPLIGDFHYDYKLAIKGIEKGLAKIRINPGNIPQKNFLDIVKAAKERNIPIRIGVNKGSVNENLSSEKLAEMCADKAKYIEDLGYQNLVLAVKSSNIKETVEAYRHLNKITDYPLHIGLTEAGYGDFAIMKSSIAIGSLLLEGIGDTIRVSLAGNPIKEIKAAKDILKATGQNINFTEIIACPTCGRCSVDIEMIAKQVDDLCKQEEIPLKIAVMGCMVNGLGEGKNADFGVACGKEKSMLFFRGKEYKTIENDAILEELHSLLEMYKNGT